MPELVILPENADLVRSWLESRGGVSRWVSHEVANNVAAKTMIGPTLDESGEPFKPQPTWGYVPEPDAVITDIEEIFVDTGNALVPLSTYVSPKEVI